MSDDTIRHVAQNFGGVEHRIELVRIKDGVRFYNDSIASSPSRTIAGLRSFKEKVILIAGGYDKHIPYDVLGPEVCQHVKKLFLCGATAQQIRTAVENCGGEQPEMVDCGDFESAVRAAAAAAARTAFSNLPQSTISGFSISQFSTAARIWGAVAPQRNSFFTCWQTSGPSTS